MAQRYRHHLERILPSCCRHQGAAIAGVWQQARIIGPDVLVLQAGFGRVSDSAACGVYRLCHAKAEQQECVVRHNL